MIPVPKSVKPPKIDTLNYTEWNKGVVTAFDDGRTPTSGLKSGLNLMLDQDGVVRPRYSLVKFGPQPVGTILGEIFPFRYANGGTITNQLITIQNVNGTAKVYTALPEDTTWTVRGSVTFNTSASARFVQQDNKVVILNGEDSIAYYDITNNSVVAFTAISDPAAPTLKTNTGLTGTSFNVYYMVTANSSVGETAGTQLKLPVSTDRDLWAPSTQNITIQWTTVTGVKSWNIYAAVTADGSSNPTWGLLASGLSADTLQYTDKGNGGVDGSTGPLNTFKQPPKQNATAGPKAKRGANINGQLWLTGDKNNPYYLWHDGGVGFQLDFTVANGGGFVSMGIGNREIPEKVWNFRSGTGEAEIKVLTSGVAGNGKRYTIKPNTISYANQQIVVWQPEEDYGFSGTNSPDALIEYGDNTYYLSADGFKTLGTRPQLQNLLSNDDVSQTIVTDIPKINQAVADQFVAAGYQGRLYFSIATLGQPKPNQIWVCDVDRAGAWTNPWDVSCDWMVVIDDNIGGTHHLVLSDNVIYEFSDDIKTNDDGDAFPTSGQTGLIYFSKDGRMWARLIKMVIEVLRPRGHVDFTVYGYTDDGEYIPLVNQAMDEDTAVSGYGWYEKTWNYGWYDINDAPTIKAKVSLDIPIDIDENLRYFGISWQSTDANVDYSLSRVVAEFVSIGIKNLE